MKELGADVDQGTNDGFTPKLCTTQFRRTEVLRCLVNELGADVNKAGEAGQTPLLIAAKSGALDTASAMPGGTDRR